MRSDKKRDVKPTIEDNLKECFFRLSYITHTPVKDVVASICKQGMRTKSVIDEISNYFIREYQFRNTYYIGDTNKKSLQRVVLDSPVRVTTRLDQKTYLEIRSLAYALDVTPTRSLAILLEFSVKNIDVVDSFVRNYLKDEMDHRRMKELQEVFSFIKKNNPSENEISWFAFLSTILDDVKESAFNIKDVVGNWLDKHTKK